MQIPINYIPREEKEPILLLSPEQISERQSQIDAQREIVKTLGGEAAVRLLAGEPEAEDAPELSEETLRAYGTLKLLESDLDGDRLLRRIHGDAVKTAVFECRDATLGDQRKIQREVRLQSAGEELEGGELSALYVEAAHGLLAPTCADLPNPPLSVQQTLAEACYRAIFPQISEDRAYFLAESQRASKNPAS